MTSVNIRLNCRIPISSLLQASTDRKLRNRLDSELARDEFLLEDFGKSPEDEIITYATYPLVMTNIAMENHHAITINGKIHYFYGHFQ